MPSPLDVLLTSAVLALAGWLFAARRRDASRAHRLLEEQAGRYAAVLDAACDAMITLDEEQRIVFANPAAAQLLDCTRAQLIGQPFQRFVPEALRERQADMMAAFARSDAIAVSVDSRIGTPVRRSDGREIDVEVSVARADEPGSAGRRRLYTLTLRDVTASRAAEEELRRLGERYRAVIDQSPDAIWLAEAGRLRLVNPAFVALMGARSPDELLGRELVPLLGADVAIPTDAPAEPRAATPLVAPPRVVPLRRLDGSHLDVELSVTPVPDHGGGALQGVMRDVTWRRQAEAELHKTQSALLQAQQIARLGYATLELDSNRWTISPSLAELLGLPGQATLDLEAGWQIVHPDDRAALREHLVNEVLGGRKPYDHEYRILRASDGQERWLHSIGRVERDAAGRPERLFATLQDITPRKLDLLALERSREELRRVSASAIWAREAERQRVARELHDELGQRLSVLKLDLAALLAQPGGNAARPAAALRQLVTGVDEAIAATRRIAADLRPSMLDDLGLSAALEWLADGWSRRTGITITVEGDPIDDAVSEAGAITVYRIVQEALTNVTRHARARHAHIDVRRDGPELVVLVEDDGRGLAPGDTDKRESSGLAGIRERARILGGVASVVNRPGGGVRLEVRLPMERVDSHQGALDAPETVR